MKIRKKAKARVWPRPHGGVGGAWVGVVCDVCDEMIKARSESSDARPLLRIALAVAHHMVVLHPEAARETDRAILREHELVGVGAVQ
jgi:hypothetical protein